MIEFGKTLRAAREAKGLTIGQIADTTHMTPNAVSELENEDFSRLPAPIYGRGFVKLYCAAVGLDPKPLLEEFMEILNGNRDVSIKERTPAEVPVPPQEVLVSQHDDAEPEEEDAPNGPAPEYPEPDAIAPEYPEPDAIAPEQPEPDAIIPDEPTAPLPQSAEHQGVLSQQDFFRTEPEPVKPLPRPAFAPRPEPPVPAPAGAPLPTPSPTPAERTVSRYSTPIDEPQTRLSPLGPSYIRLGVLAALALTVLFLLVLGVRALYRTTTGSSAESEPPAPIAESAASPEPATAAPPAKEAKPTPSETAKPAPQKASAPAAKKAAPSARTPQKIPALYVD